MIDNFSRPHQNCGPRKNDIQEILPFKIWVRTTPSFVLYVAYCTRCWLLWEPLGMPKLPTHGIVVSWWKEKYFQIWWFPLWQYLGEFGLNTNYTIDRVSTPGAIVRSKGHPVDLVCGYRSPSFLILDCSFDWLFFFFFFSPFYMWDISLLFVHSESEI